MTQDEIIRMAREAGMTVFVIESLERFAALAAAHEREKCFDAAMKAAEKAVDVAIAIEREACAKVCEQLDKESCDWVDTMAIHCAKAIRARGQS